MQSASISIFQDKQALRSDIAKAEAAAAREAELRKCAEIELEQQKAETTSLRKRAETECQQQKAEVDRLLDSEATLEREIGKVKARLDDQVQRGSNYVVVIDQQQEKTRQQQEKIRQLERDLAAEKEVKRGVEVDLQGPPIEPEQSCLDTELHGQQMTAEQPSRGESDVFGVHKGETVEVMETDTLAASASQTSEADALADAFTVQLTILQVSPLLKINRICRYYITKRQHLNRHLLSAVPPFPRPDDLVFLYRAHVCRPVRLVLPC